MTFIRRVARTSSAYLTSVSVLALSAAAVSSAPDALLAVPGRASATPSISADGSFVAVAWGHRCRRD
jgi:hypothetical protein